MKSAKCCFIICIVVILLFSLNSAIAEKNGDFIVIINKSNTETSLHEVELKRIFLRKVRQWKNGNEILPVEQSRESTVRKEFSQKILGKDVEIIITVASMPKTVNDINYIDLSDYGVVLTCDNLSQRVFVPAEIRTNSYINRYMKNKSCQVGAFRAVTVR